MNYDASFYQKDRDLGYVLRPNAAGWSVQEQEKYVRINSRGLHDREHTLQRPPNVIRIAVIGDSFAEAKQVDMGKAYWAVMENELNRRLQNTGQRVEVINFGVAWYGLAQDYLTIRDRIWQYDPQVVVLSGTLASFILKSSRQYMRADEPATTPYYVLQNGQLVLDDITKKQRQAFVPSSEWHTVFENSMNASHLLALVNAASKKLSAQAVIFAHGGRNTGGAGPEAQENLDASLIGPATPVLASAWSVAEKLIESCQAVVSSHHAEFWLITLDLPVQVDPDDQERTAFLRRMGLSDMFFADKLIANFAEREDIHHAMLAPQMLAFAEANHAVLHGFSNTPRNTGHWNEIGNRVAGELMAKELYDGSGIFSRDMRVASITNTLKP
jgi:hypothetical protein